jgi:hypothetical protein
MYTCSEQAGDFTPNALGSNGNITKIKQLAKQLLEWHCDGL